MPHNPSSPSPWSPSKLIRVVESYDTSMGTTKVKTDATFGFLKALGNRQGPHALASEFVATTMARWFGLATADFAILELLADNCFELPRNVMTLPGPAFVSREIIGHTWGGSKDELGRVDNHFAKQG